MLALALLVALVAIPGVGQAKSKSKKKASAHASVSNPKIGIQDASYLMFASPLYLNFHMKITRYIAPYDAVAHSSDMSKARLFFEAAAKEHVQVLVAFYHSNYTPLHNPSVSAYTRDVKKFVADFGGITEFQPWDESNRGNIPHMQASPDAKLAAEYYVALRGVLAKARQCRHGCADVGLDVLDQANDKTTIKFIHQWIAEVKHLHKPLPTIWGLHNYSDTNRFSDSRTKKLVNTFPGGQVWITETGGIVQFGKGFPKSLSRASRAIKQMVTDARSSKKITRLYVYNWFPAVGNNIRFDSGLVNGKNDPRPGYFTLCKYIKGANCSTSYWAKKGLPEANN
ncbi:MAG TPA: glycosyl hydrolase [Solirubrobacteraceae bacterium]|jgi:hypothetical protein|nr:glycosyl hydrolase [Solirubrobacteraceae bacterium]